jgi:transposase
MNESITTQVDPVVSKLRQELADKDACILELRGQLAILTEKFEWCQRQIFGVKSERVIEPNPEQPALGGLLDEVPKAAEEEPVETKLVKRKTKRKRRGEGDDCIVIPDGLPVEEVVIELPPEETISPVTGLPMTIIGYDISEKLAVKPEQFYIIRRKLAKYVSPEDPKLGVLCAPTPPSPIDRCPADVSLLAYFLISKYLDHLPLNRLSQIFARQDVHIHRKTMSAWAMRLGEVLGAVYDEMRLRALAAPCLFIDETTIKEHCIGKCKTRYIWVAVGGAGGGGDPPYIIYHFGTRSHKQLDEFIGKYDGAVHSDQYKAYLKKAQAGDFIWQPCGAHARRKFEESTGYSAGFRKWILRKFRYIFLYERVAWRRGPGERLTIRRWKEAPVIDEIIQRCKEELVAKTHLPKSKSRKALEYLLTNAPYMKNYIDNPEMRFDNNVAERALRPLAVGRKNWMFVGSERGGKAAAVICSVLQTCKALGINPQDYLEDVLPRILDHNSNRIGELLPDQWLADKTAQGVSSQITKRPLCRKRETGDKLHS